jgi:hypothetical protein
MHFHTGITLVALPGLAHLWIALPLFVLGRAGRRDQSDIHDRSLLYRHATCAEVIFDDLKICSPERVSLVGAEK